MSPAVEAINTIITWVGFPLGLFSLWLTHQQVKQVKTLAEHTQSVVEETKNHISNKLLLVDISLVISYVRDILDFLNRDELQKAELRMMDISHAIPSLSRFPDLFRRLKKDKYVTEIQVFVTQFPSFYRMEELEKNERVKQVRTRLIQLQGILMEEQSKQTGL